MFKPDYFVKTVYDIDFDRLYKEGISNIIFDIDNTLITYDEDKADEKLRALIRNLRNTGYKIYILSNGHSERAKIFAEDLEMVFQGDAFKPSQKGYKRLENEYGVKACETVMIGDQLFTDIWGANRFKCKSVLVVPLKTSNEPGFVKFKRFLEKPVLKRIQKRQTEN